MYILFLDFNSRIFISLTRLPPLAFYFTTENLLFFPIHHIWFDHWNIWVWSRYFTDATEADIALQDHTWCAQQQMHFQSPGPKPEPVWSKYPQNICGVDTCIFSTALTFWSAFMALNYLLLHTYSFPRWSTACSCIPGSHLTFLPYCHLCLCCCHKSTCMSQWNPHVQCKKYQGTCFCLSPEGLFSQLVSNQVAVCLDFFGRNTMGLQFASKATIQWSKSNILWGCLLWYGKTCNNQLSDCFHRL